ncbi:RloB family protein [Sphingobacterium spiritivorum]|uniref:RloB family protein n=1 Tax=Sphingobacterium spiritivorum TaxID=258 RepID=UPI003DA401AC
MILTNRLFERNPPSRDAKSIYIFCEGRRREYDYFKYFKEKDSRINIEVHQIAPNDNNSPEGLFDIAVNSIYPTEKNGNKPKYNIIEGDEVWIVIDTDPDKDDSRIEQILKIKSDCDKKQNWFVVESNPCFEVWLYYHQNNELPDSPIPSTCNNWKTLVNQIIVGGFDSRRHPIFIEEATNNAKSAYEKNNNILDSGHTEVYRLGTSIMTILAEKIRLIKSKI